MELLEFNPESLWNLEFLQLCSFKNIISSEEWFEVILLQEVWTSSNNKGSLPIGILVLLSVKLAVFKTLRKGKHTWINNKCNIILVKRTQNHLPLSLTNFFNGNLYLRKRFVNNKHIFPRPSLKWVKYSNIIYFPLRIYLKLHSRQHL